MKRVHRRLKELGVLAWFDEEAIVLESHLLHKIVNLMSTSTSQNNKLTVIWGELTFEVPLIDISWEMNSDGESCQVKAVYHRLKELGVLFFAGDIYEFVQ